MCRHYDSFNIFIKAKILHISMVYNAYGLLHTSHLLLDNLYQDPFELLWNKMMTGLTKWQCRRVIRVHMCV